MVFKATLQKESHFLPKVSSEPAVRRYSSKQVFLEISQYLQKKICVGVFFLMKLQTLWPATLFKRDLAQVFSCEYCEIFTKSFFDRKSPVASVDLTKSNEGRFLLQRVDLVITRVIYTLVVETISKCFYWLTCRNQKLVQNELLQERLYVLILRFWQCRQVFVHYEMSISKICKLARGYTYQVASRELSFAAACSEKE